MGLTDGYHIKYRIDKKEGTTDAIIHDADGRVMATGRAICGRHPFREHRGRSVARRRAKRNLETATSLGAGAMLFAEEME